MDNSSYNLYGVDVTLYESQNGLSLQTIPIMDLHQLKTIKEDKSSYFIIFWWPSNPQCCSYEIKKLSNYERPLIWIENKIQTLLTSFGFNEKYDEISPLHLFLKFEDKFDEIFCECIIKMFEEFESKPDTFLKAWEIKVYLEENPDETLEHLMEVNKEHMQWLRR